MRTRSNTRLSIHVAILVAVLLPAFLAPDVQSNEVFGSTASWTGTWQGHDLYVIVVSRGHTISEETQSNEPWWRWGNTSTDAYLFFWSDDQLVDLIVDFSLENGRPKASLYVPVVQSNRQGLVVSEGSYTLPAEFKPSVVLWPRDGGWMIDGQANFNLSGLELDEAGATLASFQVGGSTPGQPDWTTRRLEKDPSPDAGYPRFTAAVRKDPSVPYSLAQPLIPSWPYLGAVESQSHYEEFSPLFFDPEKRALGQNWVGFHVAGMYQINSITHPPDVNFESPFVFYRFDPEAGLYPNLVVRSDIWPADSAFGPPPFHRQRTTVRMSWTGEQPDLWRHSVSMTGNHVPDEEVVIGDAVFRAMSYEKYPTWVTNHEWSAISYVEAVEGEPGSEGIYEYTVEDNYTVSEWVNGLRSTPPPTVRGDAEEIRGYPEGVENASSDSPFIGFPLYHPQRLKPGFRGEYSFVYQRSPELYYSEVDGRVHLLHAEAGGWKLDLERAIRVANLDDDPYIDTWIRERVPMDWSVDPGGLPVLLPTVQEEALHILGEYVLYVGNGQVELFRLTRPLVQPALQVPVDKQSWEAFLSDSEKGHKAPPLDLRSWIERLPVVPVAEFEGEVSQVRPVDNGLRFSLAGEDDLMIVTASDGVHWEPTTGPLISGAIDAIDLVERTASAVVVRLHNAGNEDLIGGTLEITAKQEFGDSLDLPEVSVDVLAGQHADVHVVWAPPSSGFWLFNAILVTEPSTSLFSAENVLHADSMRSDEDDVAMHDLLDSPFALAGLTALAGAAMLAGFAGWNVWGRQPRGRQDA